MSDEITVGGATYYRAGSGWRLRGARDVAVGPRFCALLDEIAALRAERDAARKDAERWRFLRLRVGMYDHAAQMVGFVFPWKSLTIGDPDSLDAAIDAARAAEGGTTT